MTSISTVAPLLYYFVGAWKNTQYLHCSGVCSLLAQHTLSLSPLLLLFVLYMHTFRFRCRREMENIVDNLTFVWPTAAATYNISISPNIVIKVCFIKKILLSFLNSLKRGLTGSLPVVLTTQSASDRYEPRHTHHYIIMDTSTFYLINGNRQ